MIAATSVLVSHSWPVSSGSGITEPLAGALGYSLGKISVFVFFAISGFLIARSFERQPGIYSWFRARCLRLFPGLAVVLILTAVVLGPLVTRLPLADYFSDSETFTYVPRNLSLIFLQWELPGVFADNPFGGAINGSLWTLFHEVVCYGGVLLAGMLGAFHSRARMTACLLIFSAVYIAFNYTGLQDFASRRLDRLLFLGLPFAIGTSFYVWRAIIPLHAFLATGLIAVAALARDSLLYEPLFMLSLSYTVFVLAYLPKGRVLNYNRLGDYSYGMYVYAFPVQQLVMYLYGPLSPAGNMLLSFPLALACAVLSWTYVEKPALALARKPREQAPQERMVAGEPVGPPSITAGQS